MKKEFLIRGGKIVCEEGVKEWDILIADEKIVQIGPHLSDKGVDEVISAEGYYLLPGGIDAHTHMSLPFKNDSSCDDFSSGTKAALFGGTTTIIDFANQTRGESLQKAVDHWQKLAEQKSYCDYSFHISVTDVNKKSIDELPQMINQGITSFKTFMAYPNMRLHEKEFRTLFKEIKKLKGLLTVHAENGEEIEKRVSLCIKKGQTHPRFHPLCRSIDQEEMAVAQIIMWAKEEGCPLYIVHMTSPKAVEMVYKAQQEGHTIYGESCPQYFLLDDHFYHQEDFNKAGNYILSPPLRSKEVVENLWPYLSEGKGISVLATDHCTFSQKQREKHGQGKFWQLPNGLGGVEHRLELFFSEGVMRRRLTLEHFVHLTATNPAKIFGLYPQKGVLKVGADADIVLWNPQKKHTLSSSTHHSQCDYSPYEGLVVQGKAEKVWLRGELIINGDQFLATKPNGKRLKRTTLFNH